MQEFDVTNPETIWLKPEDFLRFLELLDDPPEANEALKKMMRQPPPWN